MLYLRWHELGVRYHILGDRRRSVLFSSFEKELFHLSFFSFLLMFLQDPGLVRLESVRLALVSELTVRTQGQEYRSSSLEHKRNG